MSKLTDYVAYVLLFPVVQLIALSKFSKPNHWKLIEGENSENFNKERNIVSMWFQFEEIHVSFKESAIKLQGRERPTQRAISIPELKLNMKISLFWYND